MFDPSVVNNVSMEPSSSAPTSQEEATFISTHPWIRHYEQGVPAHITVPEHALTWLLDRTASRYPDNTAFIYYGTKLTYAQFASYAYRFASALQRLGVHKGDRVAIALPNIPQYPIAFYGALSAGAVVVPTNPLYTEREMQYQLEDSGARMLIMLDAFYPIVRAVRTQTAFALPHGKSSFVCFKHLLSSDSALVCPPRPQRRSSALEREKNLASVKEKEKDVS